MVPLFSSVMWMLLGLVLWVVSSVLLDSSLIDLVSSVNNNNLKHKTKSYQPKLEFLKTQKFINLKQRCNKK